MKNAENWWNSIWKLRVPQKMKHFVWKLSHQWLPTNQVLHYRCVTSNASCFRCGAQCEDIFHASWLCPKISEVWRSYNFWKIIKDYQCPDVGAFLSKIVQATSLDDFEVFIAASWHMWQVRNKSLHGEKVHFSRDLVEWCYKYIDDYKKVNSSHKPGKNDSVKSKWRPPQHDCFKINVDASISKGHIGCSVATVLRNEKGSIIEARSRYFHRAFSPLVAELYAIKEGLVMAADMKISNFSIESDCANAVSLLNKSYYGCSDFDGLVDKIKTLTPRVGFKSVDYVARSANGLAHCLAKIASSSRASAVWNRDIPSVARSVFLADLPIPV